LACPIARERNAPRKVPSRLGIDSLVVKAADQEIFAFEVSDEALEAAAGTVD
jgi:hypothetical protein